MKEQFKKFLFSKHILVNDSCPQKENCFEALFAIANMFNIKITTGQELATADLIPFISKELGIHVPAPFYMGFPQSVRALSPDELAFDQMVHYTVTYGFGNFSEAGHSLMEETFERTAFKENCVIKEFSIVTEDTAIEKIGESMDDLLKSTRPISDSQYQILKDYIDVYDYHLTGCANKDTAIQLLLDTRDEKFAQFISFADIIRVVDIINFQKYGNKNIKKLNFRNQDRKFITKLMNRKFMDGDCYLRECYEKRAIWCGLLHHIHYKPVNELAQKFVDGIRNGENISVYSEFEKALLKNNIENAVLCLSKGKGSGAVLRRLNHLLSRCTSDEEIAFVMKHIHTGNPIILIQLLIQYSKYQIDKARTFKFTKYNKFRAHKETPSEQQHRKSILSRDVRDRAAKALLENLKEIYKGRIPAVYIDDSMENIALPLQENTSMGGFGTLPKGSRIHIPEGKKIRAFTYWEKVNDIDLSVIGITENGQQQEFSWRSMYNQQSDAITYSGDQTSGYYGGSEYFDINVKAFKKAYPAIKYLIFCDNVFSRIPFDRCICRAGYMLRDFYDSGEVFEPKTVDSSFTINCNSTFAYLFGIDLDANDFIWLNIARDSSAQVAGTTSMQFLTDYFDVTSIINVKDLFTMLADRIVTNPEEADVVVSDKELTTKEDAVIVHSYDFEKILAYMNV